MNVPNILAKNSKLNHSILEIIIIVFFIKTNSNAKQIKTSCEYFIGFQLTIRDFNHYIIYKMRYFIGHIIKLYGSVGPTEI